jgi:hypothetical protein
MVILSLVYVFKNGVQKEDRVPAAGKTDRDVAGFRAKRPIERVSNTILDDLCADEVRCEVIFESM